MKTKILDFIIEKTSSEVVFSPNEYKLYKNGLVSLSQIKFKQKYIWKMLSDEAILKYISVFLLIGILEGFTDFDLLDTVSCFFDSDSELDVARKALEEITELPQRAFEINGYDLKV